MQRSPFAAFSLEKISLILSVVFFFFFDSFLWPSFLWPPGTHLGMMWSLVKKEGPEVGLDVLLLLLIMSTFEFVDGLGGWFWWDCYWNYVTNVSMWCIRDKLTTAKTKRKIEIFSHISGDKWPWHWCGLFFPPWKQTALYLTTFPRHNDKSSS